MFLASLRKTSDLRNDPRYDFMVGHLLGVAEHLIYHLALYGDEKEQELARRAHDKLAFFYTGSREPLPEWPPEAALPPEKLIQKR
jgi:hypothetical protein